MGYENKMRHYRKLILFSIIYIFYENQLAL